MQKDGRSPIGGTCCCCMGWYICGGCCADDVMGGICDLVDIRIGRGGDNGSGAPFGGCIDIEASSNIFDNDLGASGVVGMLSFDLRTGVDGAGCDWDVSSLQAFTIVFSNFLDSGTSDITAASFVTNNSPQLRQ